MNDTGAHSEDIRLTLDSTLESIEGIEVMVKEKCIAAGLPEEDADRLCLALHECLVNAVVHGNRYHKDKKVYFSYHLNRNRISMTVADEGEGFDLSTVPDPLAPENLMRNSGRGLLLIKAFVDEFESRRGSPNGTVVTLVKYLGYNRSTHSV